ncbi:Os09g0450901, partial [Oryza sativa Japonica Group]
WRSFPSSPLSPLARRSLSPFPSHLACTARRWRGAEETTVIVVPPPPPPPSPRRPRWPSLPLRDGTLSTLKIRRRRWFPSGRSSADGFLRRIQRQRRNRRSGFTDGASWTDLVATTMLVAFPVMFLFFFMFFFSIG